ncbi:MAG: radical SAM protein [Candidatus Omnitrophica bacterium]|nr:radical SAM protein [Candidatus Omnitrophota bacterium]
MSLATLPRLSSSIKRLAIFVGFSCINDCRFCVVADKRLFADKTTSEIKEELADAYFNGGRREVVFTGGECTIRPDIFELVKFAKDIGYLLIMIQTNGRMFSSIDFCKKMLVAGMNQFSPALHGHTAELHDFLTRRKGSFRQTVLGIHNIRKLTKGKVKILTNTVVTKYNYRFLPQIANLLIKLGVHQYQFAFVHALGNARTSFKEVVPRKTDILPYLQKGLELGAGYGVRVMAEAMPLCLMKDYEQYVSEFYIPPTEVREAGYVIKSFEEVRKTEGKMKFPQCRICKYDGVCEGPWKEYPQFYGSGEFKPVLN